jgi:hypothetical protein
MHIAVAKVSLTKLLDELKNNHKYNSTRLEKGLKMLIISSYPPREWISDFSNDIVNAVKIDTFPLRYVCLQNNGIEYKYNQELRIPYRLLT